MKNTASFKLIWCHIARFSKKKIVHVQNMLEQVLIHFCVDWIIFKKVMTIKQKKNILNNHQENIIMSAGNEC